MTIKEAKKILGDEGKDLTDEQVQQYIDTATLFADITFDIFQKMSPKERKKLMKKSIKSKQVKEKA